MIPPTQPSPRPSSLSNPTNAAQSNLTPILDLTFVLAMLFMILLALRPATGQLPINLAESMTAAPSQTASQVAPIVIDENGNTLIESQIASSQQLESYLQRLQRESTDFIIPVAADKNAPFHAVAAVLDQLNKLKMDASLITRKNSTSE